jgi:hypothetical protein
VSHHFKVCIVFIKRKKEKDEDQNYLKWYLEIHSMGTHWSIFCIYNVCWPLQHLFLLIPGLPTSLTEVHLDGNKITKVDAPSLKGLINLSK